MKGKPTVLLIHSDEPERQSLGELAHSAGLDVAQADDGPSGLREFFRLRPDAVMLDLGVSGIDGWALIERLRELADTPIVLLSGSASNGFVSQAFMLGVDGFFVRPFDATEVIERVQAICNQTVHGDDERWIYQSNGLTVDLRSCEVFVDGERVALTGTEYRLLTYLIERRGWVLSHDQILTHVWGSDYVGEKDQVKLYVWYLRRKIEADPKEPKMIVTRRGLGYTFVG